MRSCIAYTALTFIAIASSACEQKPPVLAQGKWTGLVVPMNHPDQRTPIYYRVGYERDSLSILVGMSGADSRDARDISLSADSLTFVFDEPEADVELECRFSLRKNGSYEGPCTDAGGKSAYFTMVPPDPFGGEEA